MAERKEGCACGSGLTRRGFMTSMGVGAAALAGRGLPARAAEEASWTAEPVPK